MSQWHYRTNTGFIQKAALKKKKRTLHAPERMAQEQLFKSEHTGDDDNALYHYVYGELCKHKGRLTEDQVIGSIYLMERLGPWHVIRQKALSIGQMSMDPAP